MYVCGAFQGRYFQNEDWWVFKSYAWGAKGLVGFPGEVRDKWVFFYLGIVAFFNPFSCIGPMGWDGKIFLDAGSFG